MQQISDWYRSLDVVGKVALAAGVVLIAVGILTGIAESFGPLDVDTATEGVTEDAGAGLPEDTPAGPAGAGGHFSMPGIDEDPVADRGLTGRILPDRDLETDY